MKKILTYAAILLALATAGSVFGYFYASKSEPYLILKKEILDSKEVNKKTGSIQKITLGFFDYSEKHTGSNGRASYKVSVKGLKNEVTVFADLEIVLGEWKVKGMRIE